MYYPTLPHPPHPTLHYTTLPTPYTTIPYPSLYRCSDQMYYPTLPYPYPLPLPYPYPTLPRDEESKEKKKHHSPILPLHHPTFPYPTLPFLGALIMCTTPSILPYPLPDPTQLIICTTLRYPTLSHTTLPYPTPNPTQPLTKTYYVLRYATQRYPTQP